VGCALLSAAGASHADITFTFQEVGNDVTMTPSGTFETAGLPVVDLQTWGGTGIEENGNTDIMGGTSFGQVDISYGFNDGTDYSQWSSANGPWTMSDFSASVSGGLKSFTTYVRDGGGNQIPGLGIVQSNMDGSTWTPDQSWIWTNRTFESLGMIEGSYSVSDIVTGETITFLVVPAPASLGVMGGLGLICLRRRR
jgi:hypothetical protein